ncbi:relaxase/mobilization nuclease domain-containing protein [Occallatibacter riparius]|uniref:MobA/VirD2-like nuclease domain-containing protein n=1 Tax=Occallatibacter riparius TaxID=1002689 RepID=A0A9J7BTP0_9BACT|nr:hypothetical protein [Occallatibacter riparius]UWZ85114.1 hypothetical protein MOP44_04020 [Occallatibacter riparius]
MKGAWKAHGKYLERESAAGKSGGLEHERLDSRSEQPLHSITDQWQRAGDTRLFKIIISPEDGAGVDFRATSEDMIRALEQRTGERLEWAGIVHRNTDHSHVHIVVRGRSLSGQPLFIKPGVIREVLRDEVQRSLTRQLGPRTVADVVRQRTSEIAAFRVTGADRSMARQVARGAEFSPITPKDDFERRRLAVLLGFGLARKEHAGWLVRSDFTTQLSQMKDLQDRARILFQSGAAISDPHAPMEFGTQSRKLIGRVLLNSEDERTGQFQTAFETLDARVVILRHDATLRLAWARGDLKAGNIVSIDSLKSDPSRLYAVALGNEESILHDPKALGGIAKRVRTMGIIVSENDKGWMGELRRSLRHKETDISY